MVRWSWINFQVRGVLLVWIRVGQGPTALAVGAGGGCLDIFTLLYLFSFLSPSLWETTRYRLEYCLKGSLSPKTTNQPNTPTYLELCFSMETPSWQGNSREITNSAFMENKVYYPCYPFLPGPLYDYFSYNLYSPLSHSSL